MLLYSNETCFLCYFSDHLSAAGLILHSQVGSRPIGNIYTGCFSICVVLHPCGLENHHHGQTKYCSNSKYASHWVWQGCVLAPPISSRIHRCRFGWGGTYRRMHCVLTSSGSLFFQVHKILGVFTLAWLIYRTSHSCSLSSCPLSSLENRLTHPTILH